MHRFTPAMTAYRAYTAGGAVVVQQIVVTHKPDRNWTAKAYKERSIPIPPSW